MRKRKAGKKLLQNPILKRTQNSFSPKNKRAQTHEVLDTTLFSNLNPSVQSLVPHSSHRPILNLESMRLYHMHVYHLFQPRLEHHVPKPYCALLRVLYQQQTGCLHQGGKIMKKIQYKGAWKNPTLVNVAESTMRKWKLKLRHYGIVIDADKRPTTLKLRVIFFDTVTVRYPSGCTVFSGCTVWFGFIAFI